MLNSKKTLKNLHEKFPNLSLDDLFIILDCYIEEESFNINSPYIYYKDTFPKDWTVTCDYPKNSVADQISTKLKGGITYDTKSRYTSGTSDRWIEGEHQLC